MRKRSLCCGPVFVRPSVRLSRWTEDIVKLLCRPDNDSTLVFDPQRRYPIPRGTPSARVQNTVGKFCDFRPKSPSISETVRDRHGTWIVSHMRSIERTPNQIFKVTAFLKSNISKTVRLRDKVAIETNRKPYQSIESYHFQWPLLALD